MARIPNPYIVGTPIPAPEFFYGRESLLSFVRDTLNPPQQRVVVLYGQRRIGKTSVLYELARRLSDEFHPVYFDLMGQANRPLTHALHEIASHISDSFDIDPPAPFAAPRHFRDFLGEACALLPPDRPLLLLLDEFDDLSGQEVQEDAAAHTLFDFLRDLLNIQLPVAFIFVVGRRLTELPQNFQSILKQAPSRRVAFLGETGTRELITKPAAGTLEYTPEAIQAIYEMTSGHPYFTQLICFELFRQGMNRGDTMVSAADVELVLDSAMETGKGGLAWFWDALPLAERFVMSAIAEISGSRNTASTDDVRRLLATYDLRFLGLEVTDAPNLLVQWEILRDTGAGFLFTVDLVRRWVAAEHPLVHAKREIENLVPRANRYFANAREAHQSGEVTLAITDYRQTISANPHHLRAQLGLAQALEEKGDLQVAHRAYRDAYRLDQASARDGLANSYEQLAAQSEQDDRLPEAIQYLENAQELLPSPERLARIGQLQRAKVSQEERRQLRIRRLRYGMMFAGLSLALILTIVFFGSQLQDFFSGITGSQSASTNALGITPADPGETVILIAGYSGSEEAGLNPEANLELTLPNAFPDIRFERLNRSADDEAYHGEFLDLAGSVSAVGVIDGWIAHDSVGTGISVSDPETGEPISFGLGELISGDDAGLTDEELRGAFPEQVIEELKRHELIELLHALSGHGDTLPATFLLGRSILRYAEFDPDQSTTNIDWAEGVFNVVIESGFFEPVIANDWKGELVAYVPGGYFTRGRESAEMLDLCQKYHNSCEVDRFGASEPVAEVSLAHFFIDVHEVTNAAYSRCVEDEVCGLPGWFNSATRDHYYDDPEFANYPVLAVSWEQAELYCHWRGGHLPTEAQWEKAARWNPVEGSLTYPWGDDTPTIDLANFGPQPGDTVEVGKYARNRSPVGAYDMAGNVWEWAADYFQEDYYQDEGDSSNPKGPDSGGLKVFRGGSHGGFFDPDEIVIVDPAYRSGHNPDASPVIGFRCAFDNPFLNVENNN